MQKPSNPCKYGQRTLNGDDDDDDEEGLTKNNKYRDTTHKDSPRITPTRVSQYNTHGLTKNNTNSSIAIQHTRTHQE